jgi:hypothetical protein
MPVKCALLHLRKFSAIGWRASGWKWEMVVARNGRRAAVAVDRGRNAKGPTRRPGATIEARGAAGPDRAVAAIVTTPAFHERALIEEGHVAAFRIDAGSGWATGTLPSGSGENEIAKFLSEAIGLAKQMQTAMCGTGNGAAAVQILIADPQAGASRQSAIQVSVERSGGTVVTLQPGGNGHLVAMLQHFLMALNLPAPEAPARAAPPVAPVLRARVPGWPYAPASASRSG